MADNYLMRCCADMESSLFITLECFLGIKHYHSVVIFVSFVSLFQVVLKFSKAVSKGSLKNFKVVSKGRGFLCYFETLPLNSSWVTFISASSGISIFDLNSCVSSLSVCLSLSETLNASERNYDDIRSLFIPIKKHSVIVKKSLLFMWPSPLIFICYINV